MTPESQSLESSIVQAAVIACNKCSRVDTNLEQMNDIPFCADGFYEDGWRVVNDLALCPDCLNKLGKSKQ